MNIAVRVEAMLAGGRLKTLVFITFNVSARNRKQHPLVSSHTYKIWTRRGDIHTPVLV